MPAVNKSAAGAIKKQQKKEGPLPSIPASLAAATGWQSELLGLQQAAGNRAVAQLIAPSLPPRPPANPPVSQPGIPGELGAFPGAEQSVENQAVPFPTAPGTVAPHLFTGLRLQRKSMDNGQDAAPAPAPAEARGPEQATVPTLLVDDEAQALGPGQMRKSEFLAQLQTAICAVSDPALARVGRSTEGCPYIGHWIDYVSAKDTRRIEQIIRRFSPEARQARTAEAYIPPLAEQVRHRVERWVQTGEVTGIQEAVQAAAALDGSSSENSGGTGEGPAGTANQAPSAPAGPLFKGRDGGASRPGDPRAIQSQLGPGQPLEGGVQSRMESAFGASFANVRLHTDASAARLSGELNARAFTVGQHVAFGAGEYQPGTLIGDALIAHELAHVVQQAEGMDREAQPGGGLENSVLEEEADISAVGAVVLAWGGIKSALADIRKKAMPHLRSGLRLQRCAAAAIPAAAGAAAGGITLADVLGAAGLAGILTLSSDTPTTTTTTTTITDTDTDPALMTAEGNVIHDHIVDEARELAVALGLAATVGSVSREVLCEMLRRMERQYRRSDTDKWKKIISTQKGLGCRGSRANR